MDQLTPNCTIRYYGYMLKAIFPGSFDPLTNGHLNLIERCTNIFDELHVVIAKNKRKEAFFSAEERFQMVSNHTEEMKNIHVHIWDRLIIDFAKSIDANVIIRGVRAMADFEYEFELAMTYKGQNSSIEILFMPTDPRYFVLRSSRIKEIASYDGDLSAMVPCDIEKAIKDKLHVKTLDKKSAII